MGGEDYHHKHTQRQNPLSILTDHVAQFKAATTMARVRVGSFSLFPQPRHKRRQRRLSSQMLPELSL